MSEEVGQGLGEEKLEGGVDEGVGQRDEELLEKTQAQDFCLESILTVVSI